MNRAALAPREVGASRWTAWTVNGALGLLAIVALAPLAWMLSVSFMPTGEASGFPPPLLPSALTFDNYQQLFARAGMGRYFVNSLVVSGAITVENLQDFQAAVADLPAPVFAYCRSGGRCANLWEMSR